MKFMAFLRTLTRAENYVQSLWHKWIEKQQQRKLIKILLASWTNCKIYSTDSRDGWKHEQVWLIILLIVLSPQSISNKKINVSYFFLSLFHYYANSREARRADNRLFILSRMQFRARRPRLMDEQRSQKTDCECYANEWTFNYFSLVIY